MSAAPPAADPPNLPGRRAVVEVAAATAIVALGLGIFDFVGAWGGWWAEAAGLGVVGLLVGVPLAWPRRAGDDDRAALGLGPGAAGRAALGGLLAWAAIAVPFVIGYDVVALQLWGERRGAGVGWRSRGAAWQGEPAPVAGQVGVGEVRGGLAVVNRSGAAVLVRPRCAAPGCDDRLLAPQARAVVTEPAVAAFELLRPDGAALPPGTIALGRYATPHLEATITGEPGWAWLLWLALDQLLAVALPEELFFRGWALALLAAALAPPRRKVLGVPFGAAHVLSAALFAAIHLPATPHLHRLLVFFPGLLFAWAAARYRHIAAAVVAHAGANVLLVLTARLYGP